MVTFRCKRSGNCVSFINEGDIISTRSHEGYEEVTNIGKEVDRGFKEESKETIEITNEKEVLIVAENIPISKEVGILTETVVKTDSKRRGRPAKK